MERLTANDLMMVWPDERGWSQDIGALMVLDGRELFDAAGAFRLSHVRAVVESRLHLVPRFRQLLHRPRRGLGWPLWIDAPRFDVTHHVGVQAVAPPGDDPALLEACEGLRTQRLDPSRPLWRMTFLTGLPDRRVALFMQVHHAIADGLAGVAVLAAFVDTEAETRLQPGPSWQPAPRPSTQELLVDNLKGRTRGLGRILAGLAHPLATWRRVRRAWPALHESLLEARAPVTTLNAAPIGRHRRYALLRGRLDGARTVGNAHGGTVNDVLMAVLAAGLRELLLHRGEPVDGVVLRAAVPVALHAEDVAAGNSDGMMTVPLPVGEPDDQLRLELIAAETSRRKQKAYTPGGALFRNGLIQRAFLWLMGRQRFVNTYVANVPGPSEQLFVAGAPILEIFPLVPLQGNLAIGAGALSYAGQFNLTMVADRDLVPDLDVFAEAVRESWARIVETTTLERA